MAEYQRQYQIDNFESIKTKRRAYVERRFEEIEAYKRDWEKSHLEQHRESKRRYKIKRKGAVGSHTDAEWEYVKGKQKNRCFDCKRKRKILTRGHLVPISRDGTDYIENIVAQCFTCNRHQHDNIHPKARITKRTLCKKK